MLTKLTPTITNVQVFCRLGPKESDCIPRGLELSLILRYKSLQRLKVFTFLQIGFEHYAWVNDIQVWFKVVGPIYILVADNFTIVDYMLDP